MGPLCVSSSAQFGLCEGIDVLDVEMVRYVVLQWYVMLEGQTSAMRTG